MGDSAVQGGEQHATGALPGAISCQYLKMDTAVPQPHLCACVILTTNFVEVRVQIFSEKASCSDQQPSPHILVVDVTWMRHRQVFSGSFRGL